MKIKPNSESPSDVDIVMAEWNDGYRKGVSHIAWLTTQALTDIIALLYIEGHTEHAAKLKRIYLDMEHRKKEADKEVTEDKVFTERCNRLLNSLLEEWRKRNNESERVDSKT